MRVPRVRIRLEVDVQNAVESECWRCFRTLFLIHLKCARTGGAIPARRQLRHRLAALLRVGPGRVVERHGAARQPRTVGRRQTGRLALMEQPPARTTTGTVGIGGRRRRARRKEQGGDQRRAPAERSQVMVGVGAEAADETTCRRQRDRRSGGGGAKDGRPVRPATGRVVCHAREHSTVAAHASEASPISRRPEPRPDSAGLRWRARGRRSGHAKRQSASSTTTGT